MPEDSFGFRRSEETNRPQGASFQGNSGLQPFHFFPSGDAVTGLQGLGRGYISISWAAPDLNSKCGSLSPSSTACSHPWGCLTAPPGPTVPAAARTLLFVLGTLFNVDPEGKCTSVPVHTVSVRGTASGRMWEWARQEGILAGTPPLPLGKAVPFSGLLGFAALEPPLPHHPRSPLLCL